MENKYRITLGGVGTKEKIVKGLEELAAKIKAEDDPEKILSEMSSDKVLMIYTFEEQ